MKGDQYLELSCREIVSKIINGCVQEYPVSVDSLNEFECVVTMPKDMVASIVAQDLQNMTHWGGVRASIQCTLASNSKLKNIVENREKSRQEGEQEVSFPKQQPENKQMPIEEMIGKMMTGILNSVDEKLRSITEKKSSLCVRPIICYQESNFFTSSCFR